MAPAVRRKKRKDEIKATIGPFRNLADYKACEDIQREVWHMQDIDVVPVPLLLAANRTGGILLGAFNSLGDMVGFVFSMLGSLDGKPIHHSYMLAVRMAYRNFDVAFKLKMAQRKEALKRKISLITASFDPMQPLNAYFALGKLGECARCLRREFLWRDYQSSGSRSSHGPYSGALEPGRYGSNPPIGIGSPAPRFSKGNQASNGYQSTGGKCARLADFYSGKA